MSKSLVRTCDTCLFFVNTISFHMAWTHLIHRDLSHNKLERMPDSFNSLRIVKTMHFKFVICSFLFYFFFRSLAKNRLTCLPDDLTGLSTLNDLFVAFRALISIFTGFFTLIPLRDLSDNLFNSFPKSIFALYNLRQMCVNCLLVFYFLIFCVPFIIYCS